VDAIKARTRGNAEAMTLDLARLKSVRAFADAFRSRHPKLDVLVNNAGVFLTDRVVTEDGFEQTFQVNHLGPFLLTQLLLDALQPPARIVNVSSDAHRGARNGVAFDDLQREHGYLGMRVYGESKLMNILFTRELARRLPGGVTANAVHPGGVRTGFGMDGDATGFWRLGLLIARPFLITPERGAQTSIYLASSPEVEGRTGEYWYKRRQKSPTTAAQDYDAARRLWDVSEELLRSAG
jgi:NAD(P)-dependent dehydrogenase (short-subunit alcohol dehydrogenase family)